MTRHAKADCQASTPLPGYLVDTYSWAYLDARNARLLDHQWVVNAILMGNYDRLVRTACAEFRPGERVLQAASAYGDLSLKLARALGPAGSLDIIDVAPLQVERLRAKLAGCANVAVRVADAATPGTDDYDAVCCFFLLHEMPDDYKARVVTSLLGRVRPGGRVVFVDYAQPAPLHPLRPLIAVVFRLLEPYARSLVRVPLESWAPGAAQFHWRHRRFFGGLYQVVVAERAPIHAVHPLA